MTVSSIGHSDRNKGKGMIAMSKVYGVCAVRFWADTELYAQEYGVDPEDAYDAVTNDVDESVKAIRPDNMLPWRGAEIVGTMDRVDGEYDMGRLGLISEETRTSLLVKYDQWAGERRILSAAEGSEGVTADEWQDSDDMGTELLHEFAAALRLTKECGHSSAEAEGDEDGRTVKCPDCGRSWVTPVPSPVAMTWADGHGNWHARTIEFEPGDPEFAKAGAWEEISEQLIARGAEFAAIRARMEVEQVSRKVEGGIVTTEWAEKWREEMAEQSDAELFEAGARARDKAQCPSVIVATDEQGIRNYHNCDGDRGHESRSPQHGCGCGQTWRHGTEGQGMVSAGPLTDVVFVPGDMLKSTTDRIHDSLRHRPTGGNTTESYVKGQ